MSLLSQGPFSHNRFRALDELYAQEKQYFTEKKAAKKSKPDFLDVDGDGDKEESFKKGVKDKEKGDDKKEGKKGKKELPDFMKKKMDMKEGKCSAGCDCKECDEKKKKALKEWIVALVGEGYDLSEYNMEQMEEMFDNTIAELQEEEQQEMTIEEAVMEYLMDNGFANNLVSAEVVYSNMSETWRDDVVNQIHELYQGKHGQSEKQYQDGRSDAAKLISGDSKGSGANYSYKAKNTGANPAGGSQRPQGQGRITKGDKNDLLHRKGEFMKKHGFKAK